MKLLVPVKRVVDYAVKVRVNAKKTGIELSGVKMSMNPFCEIALEEAVRLKEKKKVKEIVALTIGPKQGLDVLRQALAQGADKGVHLQTDLRVDKEIQPFMVAQTLQHFVERDKFDMVIMGKQSIDGDYNQTGQMLAGLLKWPQATFASNVRIFDDLKSCEVDREVDGGIETLKLSLPCLVTCDLRLNEPRFASIPQIMKAKKKKVESLKLEDQGLNGHELEILSVEEPKAREGGVIVESVDELQDKLKNEAKVL